MKKSVFGLPKTSEPWKLVKPKYDKSDVPIWWGKTKPIDKLKKWKVCICPWCGEVQVTSANEKLVCVRCGKHARFRVRARWQVRLWDFDDERLAIFVCQKIKEKLDKNKKKWYART